MAAKWYLAVAVPLLSMRLSLSFSVYWHSQFTFLFCSVCLFFLLLLVFVFFLLITWKFLLFSLLVTWKYIFQRLIQLYIANIYSQSVAFLLTLLTEGSYLEWRKFISVSFADFLGGWMGEESLLRIPFLAWRLTDTLFHFFPNRFRVSFFCIYGFDPSGFYFVYGVR